MDIRVHRVRVRLRLVSLAALSLAAGCAWVAHAGVVDLQQSLLLGGVIYALALAALAFVDARAAHPLTILAVPALGAIGMWLPAVEARVEALLHAHLAGIIGPGLAGNLVLPLTLFAAGLLGALGTAAAIGSTRPLERGAAAALGVAAVPLVPSAPDWVIAAAVVVWQAVLIDRAAAAVLERTVRRAESCCHRCAMPFPDVRPLICPRCKAVQESTGFSRAANDQFAAIARSRLEPPEPLPAHAAFDDPDDAEDEDLDGDASADAAPRAAA